MVQVLVLVVFFMVALSIFWLALHFSQYKKRPSACCGGGHCETGIHKDKAEGTGAACYTEKINFVNDFGK